MNEDDTEQHQRKHSGSLSIQVEPGSHPSIEFIKSSDSENYKNQEQIAANKKRVQTEIHIPDKTYSFRNSDKMPRFSSTDSFKTRTSSQVRQKGSTFHSVKEIKQGVGDKLEFMYRIESDGIVDKKIYNRQKLKTYFFFTIDLAVMIVCTYALFKKFTDW